MIKYIKTFLLAAMALSVTVLSGKSAFVTEPEESADMHKGKQIEVVAGSDTFGENELDKIYGFCDHVVVVKIESEGGTTYKNVTDMGNGKKFGIPYTSYKVKVVKNLKGELPTNKNIDVKKAGGLSYDKDKYFVDEDDQLPEEGKYYVMAFCVQSDGSLLSSGSSTTLPIKRTLFSFDGIEKYQDACDNSVTYYRERYVYKE